VQRIIKKIHNFYDNLIIKHVDNSHLKYRPDIDGLRAIAVLSVVLFHAFPGDFPGGFIGVDIFFVISGYLISKILFSEIYSHQFSFLDFYSSRIRRIFPALLIVLIFTITIGWFILFADEYARFSLHIISGTFFYSNFLLWQEAGYFDPSALSKPLLHLWSLGIEEQFYIIWPAAIFFSWRYKYKWKYIILLGGGSSFLYCLYVTLNNPLEAFYSPVSRFWELLVGATIAYINIQKRMIADLRNSNIISGFGGILIIVGLCLINNTSLFPGAWAIFPTIGAALIISSGEDSFLNRKILSNQFLVSIGLISYPLYLWHWPIFSFSHILFGEKLSGLVSILLIGLAVLFSVLTFNFIEKPIRRFTNIKKVAFALILSMLMITLFGLILFLNKGFKFRLEEFERMHAPFVAAPGFTNACLDKFNLKEEQFCHISSIKKPINAAIIGDSHAWAFHWGLEEYYKQFNLNLANFGAGDCPPFLYIDRGRRPGNSMPMNCYKKTSSMYEYVLNEPSIKDVFLAFNHVDIFRKDIQIIDIKNEIKESNNFNIIREALIRTVKLLRAKGKNVYLIRDWPSTRVYMSDCFSNRPFSPPKENCDLKNIFVNNFEEYDELLRQVTASTNLKVFNTHEYLDGNFPVSKDGLSMYQDNSHLSLNGSLFFKDKLGLFIESVK